MTTTEQVQVNGVELQVTHAGDGPMVLLLHGFPELSYSWRHQIEALAAAGYHAVAPNQRGYDGSSRPEPIEAYNIFELVGDAVALAAHFDSSDPAVVGHDWGSMVAWQCALMRPDLFRGVMGMSVPYLPRGPMSILDLVRAVAGDGFHYIVHFQQPGVAEAELDADPRRTMHEVLWGASGDRPASMVSADPSVQTRMLQTEGVPDGLESMLKDLVEAKDDRRRKFSRFKTFDQIEEIAVDYDVMVRGLGYVRSLADLEAISVGADSSGTPVRLKDVE